MDVKVIDAAKTETVLKKATFAGGCFWGLELAFQRAKGVISTKVSTMLNRTMIKTVTYFNSELSSSPSRAQRVSFVIPISTR